MFFLSCMFGWMHVYIAVIFLAQIYCHESKPTRAIQTLTWSLIGVRTVLEFCLPDDYGSWYSVGMAVAMIVFLTLCFRISICEALAATFMYVVLSVAICFFSVIVVRNISYIPEDIFVQMELNRNSVIVQGITTLITNLVYMVVLVFFYIHRKLLPERERGVLPILAGYQLGILWMYVLKCQNESRAVVGYGVALSVLVLLLTVVVLKHIYMEIEREKAVQQIEEIYRQRSCDLQYYSAVEEQKKQFHDLQHYFFEQLERMNITMQNVSCEEMIPRLVADTTYSLEQTVVRRYCENPVVNAVLFVKLKKAQERKIHYEVHTDVPVEVAIDAIDLCSVFCNLLDNAIEACDKISDMNKRHFQLNVVPKIGFLIIRLSNSMEGQVRRSKRKILTTKKNVSEHGYGLALVREIVEKYDGELAIREENCTFCIQVSLRE